jgi:hypothetical protein
MASISQAVVARPSSAITGRRGLIDKYFYFAMSLLVAVIVVYGFGHTVNSNLFNADVPRPRILWFHAAAFSGWVLFFILQSSLVRTHNVRLHRTLGWFGLALAVAMVLLGITTAIIMGRFNTHILHLTGARFFEIIAFNDVLTFAILISLGIYWRRKPELHRRLLFLATCALLAAAFGRMPYIAEHNIFYASVDCVALLGVARDLLVDRRVHKVYRIALPLMMVTQAFVIFTWLSNSPWWVRIANDLMG